jgi:D-tyrosyl-tRNA(Tyr) deacylase
MRALIQRVSDASVEVQGRIAGRIGPGLLVFLGIEDSDTAEDLEWMAGKILRLRILDDEKKIPNLSVVDLAGGILVVSQFTLFASTKKGNRPSYIRAGAPDKASQMVEAFAARLRLEPAVQVECGVFGADMKVRLTNDGPFTIWIDSKARE